MITNRQLRLSTATLYQRRGIVLLGRLEQEMNAPGSAKNESAGAFEARRTAHRVAGLYASTVVAWNAFTDTYSDLNDNLTGPRHSCPP